ncbi:MAG: cation transporter [Burkholderiales bacterium RIFCSPLOWO2_12_67_14]|nr:MAG: cation transporter [Burkholderiales bacterium RIFCSPLOWO2_02_FULL_67_64]OGB35841.1 MAG: cation transporter [Burkholderiales bacterium RIFCSPHIGHO2_12_FULL_67_38]OGB44123.1 MAG: cation transporter [Burkholderiales bacterium RIFCSPLOWO2_12_67_14]OGB79776.1 MAG: cation transporter [Burkholderiales bacterium RIFCSPLOWO2_12_FULL_67_210]
MSFLRSLVTNHPLANIAFVVVLLLGLVSYNTMPREQDPEINFNWVSVSAVLPGASAEEVERLVTNPLEDGIKGVADVRFVVSNSRENIASLLVRFREINERTFDKRMADLRREIQNKASSELPREAKDPMILEITTSNGFPTAALMLTGQADDEALRLNARRIKGDLERIAGVDQVYASGLRDPELLVSPNAQALAARGLLASDVADAVSAWWRDTSGGTLKTRNGAWSISVKGVLTDPQALEGLPVVSATRPGVSARLGEVARIERARAPAAQYAATDGHNAVSLAVTKKSRTNTLELVDRLKAFIEAQNPVLAASGLQLALTDDQTVPTREAIGVMQTNALYGVTMVLAVCWLFLGWRIGVLVAVGIPFSLMGTFAVLDALGHTVNVSVLLGVVIALGMLVDDAVVVVESIFYRMQRGQETLSASLDAVVEVWKPVVASVATTMAAFLPLMLLPGIVGKFMFVIPFVVTLALLISLVEAFWMMPVHVSAIGLRFDQRSRVQAWRERFNRGIRLRYGQALAYVLRRPGRFALLSTAAVAAAVALLVVGVIRVQFFAFDPIRAFYVNVDMPQTASLEDTLAETQRVEAVVRQQLRGIGPESEARAVTSVAGLKFTDTEPVYGDLYGQVFVSLNPRTDDAREVTAVVEGMRQTVEGMDGPGRKSFTVLAGGPPAGKAISVKVRGDDFEQIQRAADALKAIVAAVPGAKDVQDDNQPGRAQLQLRLDHDAVRDAGLNAAQVARLVRLAVDGEVVAFTRIEGDKIELRVRSDQALRGGDQLRTDPASLLDEPVALPNGQTTRLGALVQAQVEPGRGFIRHYNLRRTITVEANLDKEITDTKVANDAIKAGWEAIRVQHPGVDLDFSGELEDIEESLAAMQVLFLLGLGLIYLILAAQFKSYWQPLMILVTVPLAFTGVAYGLAISNNPLSLYTLYGVIALTGIAVNSAIVLIDAANDRMARGMSTIHAIVQASRRRVVPILITTTTTIGGLFSLAFGIGGHSLLWGPVAASIVWGLAFSTVLTLFVVPMLYLAFMRGRDRARQPQRRRWWRRRTAPA